MQIGDLLERGGVLLRARARDKHSVLNALAQAAGKGFHLPSAQVLAALEAREALGSTGLGGGLAIPHARVAGADRVRALFLKLDRPVAFDAVDERPVDLFLCLIAPLHAEPDHLRALAAASRLLRQRGLVERIREAPSSEAVLALLTDQTREVAA